MKIGFSMYKLRKINARVEMKKKADLFCLNSNT